jgi:hypothetical protein
MCQVAQTGTYITHKKMKTGKFIRPMYYKNPLKYLFVALIFMIMSCEKLFMEADMENTHDSNFELLWKEIDEKYSFFQYKNINWDSIYHIYKPQVTNDLSDQQFFGIMASMVNELRDGHVNLYSDFDRSRNFDWLAGPVNFNFENIQKNYLGVNFRTIGPFFIREIDSVGYIYSGSFAGEFRKRDIDKIIEEFSGMKGIIFDVRSNSGGLSRTGKLVAGRFTSQTLLVSYTKYKTGPGHEDFSEPQPNFISPQGNRQFLKPVAVLSNRRTYSATNDFVVNMAAIPHVTIIGDKTGGGGGTPYDYELPNGWRCRFPRTQTLTSYGFNVEHGIEPDIKVDITSNDEARGIDTIIEAALKHIHESPLH